jgi:hypothetical protein
MPDFFYEGHNQVLAERNSLKDQLSEANRKIADLENKARAFEVQGIQQFLKYQVSRGKKEKDDGKDEEIERLEGELGIKISLTDQQSVGEKVIKRFEYHMQSKDEKIRLLKYELATKDEEMQRLKSQQDRREVEYGRLRNTMQTAYTDMVPLLTMLLNLEREILRRKVLLITCVKKRTSLELYHRLKVLCRSKIIRNYFSRWTDILLFYGLIFFI